MTESNDLPPKRDAGENCNARRTEDGEFVDYCDLTAGHGTDHLGEGRCKFHDGPGAPKGNSNRSTHNLTADNNKLYQRLDPELKAGVDEMHEDYRERYIDLHGDIPKGHDDRLKQISIEFAKEILADNWQSEQAKETDHPLIESAVVGVDEQGNEIEDLRPNRIDEMINRLSRRNRQWLKDLGLMPDPESKKAEAMGDQADAWRDYIGSS